MYHIQERVYKIQVQSKEYLISTNHVPITQAKK